MMAASAEWTRREAWLDIQVPIYGDSDEDLEQEALRVCDAVDAAHTMGPPEHEGGHLSARLNYHIARVRQAICS